MMAPRPSGQIASEMGYSTPESVVVRGMDLSQDLIGHVSLTEMVYLSLSGRLPSAQEKRILDAVLVTLVEHGVTPSTLAARLTYLGAPESLQAAVAAGVLGVGSRFVGTVGDAAQMLFEAQTHGADANRDEVARATVRTYLKNGSVVPGLGHPLHKEEDPRTTALFNVAKDEDRYGPYIALMEAVQAAYCDVAGRPIPINATGAVAAVTLELGLPWQIARGVGIISRTVGILGHIQEEMVRPFARELWSRVEDEIRGHGIGSEED